MAPPTPQIARLRFSSFEVDLATMHLYKRGNPHHLQEKPFQILVLLLERPGEIVTREDLQKRLWPDGTFVDFDKGLNTAVKKLRYALGDSADTPLFVETLPRRGYRFIAPVTAINGANIYPYEPLSVSHHWGSGQAPGPKNRTRPRGLAVLAAIAAMLGIVGQLEYRWLRRTEPAAIQGMQVTKLTQAGVVREMAISPDGKRFTYALRDGIRQSLWIQPVGGRAGSELQLLVPDTVNFAGITFSLGGNFIYFSRSERTNPVFGYMCRMPATGGPVEELIRDADSPPSFSPDGKHFVYTRGYPPQNRTEVRIANSNGAEDRLLVTLPGHQVYEAGATWSPNNDVIAVPMRTVGPQVHFVLDIVSLADGHSSEIYSSPGAIGRPMWRQSGKELLVVLSDEKFHRGQLWTISYPGGKAHRFTNDLSDYSSAIDLTKDETKIATIVTSIVSNLWAAPADDLSHPAQLTSGEPYLFRVNELSDGKLLVLGDGVWTMDRDARHRSLLAPFDDPEWIESCGDAALVLEYTNGKATLLHFPLAVSNGTPLVSGDVLFPACSSDGKSIYYLNFHHPEMIRRIVTKDGSSADIAPLLGDTLFGNISVSPDSTMLAYPYQQYSPPLVALAVLPATGGAPVTTFRVPGFVGRIRWSPRGDALQYLLTENGATNLWEQPLSGGGPWQLTHFNTGQVFDFSWSRDHRRLLLTRGHESRDVVLIEDTRHQ